MWGVHSLYSFFNPFSTDVSYIRTYDTAVPMFCFMGTSRLELSVDAFCSSYFFIYCCTRYLLSWAYETGHIQVVRLWVVAIERRAANFRGRCISRGRPPPPPPEDVKEYGRSAANFLLMFLLSRCFRRAEGCLVPVYLVPSIDSG